MQNYLNKKALFDELCSLVWAFLLVLLFYISGTHGFIFPFLPYSFVNAPFNHHYNDDEGKYCTKGLEVDLKINVYAHADAPPLMMLWLGAYFPMKYSWPLPVTLGVI